MINLTPRLRAARLSISRLTIDLNIMRMQRNVYRDHLARIISATAKANEAVARSAHTDSNAVQVAMGNLTALCLMAQDYDDLQSITDTTIQEN